jgi:flagellar basal-body rod protein FlgB
MDVGKMSLFATLKKRMDYLDNRQEVLADNIANADTPKYVAKDLKPFDFKDLMRRQKMHVKPVGTSPMHIGTSPARIRDYALDKPKPYESTINGNQVVLEEQMTKMSESQIDHELTTELYRKNMSMFKIALGKR